MGPLETRATEAPTLPALALELLRKSVGFFLDYDAFRSRTGSGKSKGPRVYYAVDYDVIYLYLNPRSMSRYANFFGAAEDEPSRVAMSFLLGDYFFSPRRRRLELSPLPSYLLWESHFEELMDGLSSISSAATESIMSDSEINRIIAVAKDVLDRDDSPQEQLNRLVKVLSAKVSDLLKAYDKSLGRFQALERYAMLRNDGLRRIDSVDWFSELSFQPLPESDDPRDRLRLNQLVIDWTRRLRKTSKYQTEKALRNDALVLASLQLFNEKCLNAKIEARMCLITGSEYIFEAAAELSDSFTALYLRHPQAFLMDQEFFAPEHPSASISHLGEASTLKLFDWLNLCLPKAVKSALNLTLQGVNSRVLDNIYNESSRDPGIAKSVSILATLERGGKPDRDLINELKTQIAVHAASIYSDIDRLSRVGEYSGAHNLASMLRDVFNAKQLDVESLRSTFDNRLLELLDRILLDAGWYSIVNRSDGITDDVRLTPQGVGARKSVPALCFDDGFPKSIAAGDRLIKYQEHGVDLTARELKQIYNDIVREDKSLYHAYMIFGLLFSLKGYWQPASSLAERAIQIADGIRAKHGDAYDPKKERRNGREAAYLVAVAKRRLIRDIADLDKAAKFLEQARVRISDDGSDFVIRFDSEDLAIATRRILLEYYCGQVGDSPTPDILEVMTRISAIVERCGQERRAEVRDWVSRQSAVNYLNLLVILYSARRQLDEASEMHRKMLDLLGARIEKDANCIANDPHACITYLVGVAILDRDGTEFERASVRFKHLLDIIGNMPYDVKRRDTFKAIIDSRLPD